MSIAAETRDAARRHPFLLHALRAGVVNYAAAAEFLAIDGETDAIATALRRFAEELPEFETTSHDARVTMQSGVRIADEGVEDPLLAVGTTGVGIGDGSLTAVLATGDVDPGTLGAVCSRLAVANAESYAAGVAGETLVVVVGRRDGATTVRIVEEVLANVPV
jgi:hypothetical protein